jgi:hypothetical protein
MLPDQRQSAQPGQSAAPTAKDAAPGPPEAGERIPVDGAEGWCYLPFERDEQTREHHITLVRDDGETVEMTLPAFVERGDELGEIARLVIRARERWRELKGLGS